MLKIKCETDLGKPRQIIAPITTINPKIKIIRKPILCLGIKEQFSHENEK